MRNIYTEHSLEESAFKNRAYDVGSFLNPIYCIIKHALLSSQCLDLVDLFVLRPVIDSVSSTTIITNQFMIDRCLDSS